MPADVFINNNFSRKTEVSGFTLERTVKLMKLSFSRVLLNHPELDVTVDQWVVLQLLAQKGTMNQYEIADAAFKDAPTITRMIDLMEGKNLVIRESDTEDKRRFVIKLTEEGLKKYRFIKPIVHDFRDRAYAGLTASELQILDKTLKKIFDNLSK